MKNLQIPEHRTNIHIALESGTRNVQFSPDRDTLVGTGKNRYTNEWCGRNAYWFASQGREWNRDGIEIVSCGLASSLYGSSSIV